MKSEERLKILIKVHRFAHLARRGTSPALANATMAGLLAGFGGLLLVVYAGVPSWIALVLMGTGVVLGWRLTAVKNPEVEMWRLLGTYEPDSDGEKQFRAFQAAAASRMVSLHDVLRWVEEEMRHVRPLTAADHARVAFAHKQSGVAHLHQDA